MTNCPICNREAKKTEFNLIRCATCELIFDENIFKANINKEQNEKYFEECLEMDENVFTEYFNQSNVKRTYKRLKKFISKDHSILEVGVGNGTLLKYFNSKGYRIKGCDLSKSISEFITKNYKIEVTNSELKNMEGDEKFDVIIMNHCMEHVSNPVDEVTTLHNKLSENGLLLISVPNVNCFEAKFKNWNCYEPYHLLYFNMKSLSTLIGDEFTVLEYGSYESITGWFNLLVRTFAKRTSIKPTSNHKQIKKNASIQLVFRLTSILFGTILLPIRYFQSIIGKGDEIYLVCRKK